MMWAFQGGIGVAYQAVFKRYELKYLLTKAQKERVLAAMEPYRRLDKYGRTTVRNVYFDTDSYRLIRRSMEKPVYKEKLRLRSYRKSTACEGVFVELKKKYKSVVYKRRLLMPEDKAMDWLCGNGTVPDSQIAREIAYFKDFYSGLRPAVFLSYEREAYYSLDGGDFRITFDDNILCRQTDLSLSAEVGGTAILPEGKVLMEIKTAGGIPLWMTHCLTEQKLYKTSFSKYGTAFASLIFPKLKGGYTYV